MLEATRQLIARLGGIEIAPARTTSAGTTAAPHGAIAAPHGAIAAPHGAIAAPHGAIAAPAR
jgi:hypothetical protein